MGKGELADSRIEVSVKEMQGCVSVAQGYKFAVWGSPSLTSGVLKKHKRREAEAFRQFFRKPVGVQQRTERACEVDRLIGQLDSKKFFASGCRIPFGKYEIQDIPNSGGPAWDLLGLRYLYWYASVSDLSFRPN